MIEISSALWIGIIFLSLGLAGIFVYFFFNQKQKITQLNGEIVTLNQGLNEKSTQISQLEQNLIREETLKESLKEQIKSDQSNEEKFKQTIENQFKLIAQNILDQKSNQIKSLQLEELNKVIDPFKSDVLKLEKRVNEVHDSENKQRASLEKTIENLIEISNSMKMEANKLSKAIVSDNKQQGNWGEMVLEKLLQSAGLREKIHYHTQQHIPSSDINDSSAIRPDVIVNLPDDKKVIIDSKVSIKHFYQSLSAENQSEKERLLKEHYQSITRHIKELSNKHYPEKISGSLNYVLMFVPFESALSIAMEYDSELYQKAVKQNILIVTPSTLIVSLNVIQSLWQSEDQRRNIARIVSQGNKIYEKARLFIEDIDGIGKSLVQVQNKYQSAQSRLYQGKGNLISLSENMKNMGLSVKKNIPDAIVSQAEIDPVESQLSNQSNQSDQFSLKEQTLFDSPHSSPKSSN